MASQPLHGEMPVTEADVPLLIVEPLAWWEMGPRRAKETFIAEPERLKLRRLWMEQLQRKMATGITVWHRMLGRTYCLI